MTKLPTAEEFLKDKLNEESLIILKKYFNSSVEKQMIEFAKLHVKAALEAALSNAQLSEHLGDDSSEWIVPDSILNAYPLNLIT